MRGFDPYSPLYYLICDSLSKLVSLELYFDTCLRVFNDLADSSRRGRSSKTSNHPVAAQFGVRAKIT